MLPWDNPFDENGNPVPNQYEGWVNSKGSNYLYDLSKGNYGSSCSYDLAGGFDFDIKIMPWLTFSSVNNYSYYNSQSHGYTDPKSVGGEGVDGRITEYNYNTTRRYTNQLLRFQKSWGKHNVNGLLAYEFNDWEMKFTDVYATGFFQVLRTSQQHQSPKRPTAIVRHGLSSRTSHSGATTTTTATSVRFLCVVMVALTSVRTTATETSSHSVVHGT